MKIHIGADVNSGAVQSVRVTAANEADINRLSNLLREDDQAIFADAGYSSESYEIRFAPVGFARVCQGQAQTGTREFECVTEKAQPARLAGQGASCALVSGHQMSVWLSQSPLQGSGEKHSAGHEFDGAGQAIPISATDHGTMTGSLRLTKRNNGWNSSK